MKKLLLLAAVTAFLTLATAVTATYPGEIEKEGPEADLILGYASDQPARVELSIPEREGLNITYPEQIDFNPDEASRTVQRQGESIPLIEIGVVVESQDIVQQEYEIPVILRAYRNRTQEGSTRPRIVQEREFSFKYITAESPDFGFEGDLINSSGEAEDLEEPDETLNLSEENTITEEETNTTEGGGNPESGSGINPVLAAAVILVFGYTIYEAFT